jgi:hypothetical protein
MNAPSCYTVAEVIEKLKLSARTFRRLKQEGKLPFLEEIRPPLGRFPRYRADLVDTYLRNEWQRDEVAARRRWSSRHP